MAKGSNILNITKRLFANKDRHSSRAITESRAIGIYHRDILTVTILSHFIHKTFVCNRKGSHIVVAKGHSNFAVTERLSVTKGHYNLLWSKAITFEKSKDWEILVTLAIILLNQNEENLCL